MSDKYLEKYPIPEDNFAASSGDCTGLTPTPAHDEYEAESYEDLYPYLPPAPPTIVAKGIHNEII